MPSSIPYKISLFRCWPRGIVAFPRENSSPSSCWRMQNPCMKKMDTSSGSWEDYHLALVEQWLMAIAAQRESGIPRGAGSSIA